MHLRSIGLSAAAVLVISACAGSGPDTADAEPRGFADYEADPRLGEQVDRICFGREIDGFGETTDDTVLVEAGIDEWYLLHTSRCPDLDFAQALAFDRFGSCLSVGDDVIPFQSFTGPRETDPRPLNCPIRAIYQWDHRSAPADAP